VVYQGEAPVRFFAEELSAWRRWLERFGGEITSSKLERSAHLHNRIRSMLRKLQQRVSEGRLPYFWLHAATVAAQSMERELVVDLLDQALAELDALTIEGEHNNRPRIIVIGAILDHPRPLRWLADHNVEVVTDDTCAIARSFEEAMDLDLDDPFADMAKRHLRRSPCPVQLDSAARRCTRLAQQIRRYRAQGVVFFPYKGCEPHGFDNVILAESLDRQKVPHLTLEIDPHLGSWGQITTRLEAFVEMLSGELDDNELVLV
jgi:benzoyl-CoA reductase/2-hydroxyglutaryl-CoA dehydratase subunit BcrC/BadD/HgdB